MKEFIPFYGTIDSNRGGTINPKEHESNDPVINVEGGEWKIGKNGQILKADAYGINIVMIIQDVEKKVAMVGYFFTSTKDIHDVISQTGTIFGTNRVSKLQVYLTGGAPMSFMGNASPHIIDRNIALRDLKTAGLKEEQINQNWIEDPDEIRHILVDTQSGDIETTSEKLQF